MTTPALPGGDVVAMADTGATEEAHEPEGLARLFFPARANAGDVEGWSPSTSRTPPSPRRPGPSAGAAAIRDFYPRLFAGRPQFAGEIQPALRPVDLALT